MSGSFSDPGAEQSAARPQPGYGGGQGPSGPRANFGQRLLAAIVDAIILSFVGFLIQALFNRSAGGFLSFVAGLAYYIYLEGGPSGQTAGKRLLQIRVVDFDTGSSIGYARAGLRYVAKVLSTIPCFLGYLWMLWDREKQTWHDKLSTSVVVPTAAYPVQSWPG